MSSHGRYSMIRKVADGGMAEIYLAKQTGEEGFSRLVIVKRILPGFSNDPHFRDMLLDEAHIAMTLNHSNVVPVLDLGRADGSYFLVMELVDGWDLANIYDRGRDASFPLPLGISLYIMAEVLRGLGYAHGRRDADGRPLGIVHRDVSPHNMLISEHGEVKVTDFGIAKALGKRDRTQTGLIKGKLDFMSPEQASGGAIDASSDIFAAGTALYLLSTGRRPFASPSDMEALLRVQRADFIPPEDVRHGLSPAVANIVKKAMKARQADRYRSAEEMMLDLETVMRTEFGSPGQSQLKRWLAELTARDGVAPLSRRPAPAPPAAPDSLSNRWFAEGDMLSFEDSSKIAGLTGLRAGAATAGTNPLSDFGLTGAQAPGSPAANPAVVAYTELPRRESPPPPAAPPSVPPVRPRPLTPGPARPGSRSMRRWMSRSYAYQPRGTFWRRVMVVVLLLAAGGLAATQVIPEDQQAKLQADARTLVKRGVEEVTSAIQNAAAPARPEALDEKALRDAEALKEGAAAAMPDDDRNRRGGRRTRRAVTVTLLSNPPGAEVLGARGRLGVTPLPFTVRVGASETLTFRKEGYADVERRITGPRKDGTVSVDLPARSAIAP
jgi:eukaryotic-like serine/threonine-protein kinase